MDQTYYEYGFFAKENLLRTVAPPRVILIGGSNAVFSFDSQVIRAEMHENVVNASLHIGFGIRYWLNVLDKYARKGDLIVICPEYEQFYGVFWGNETLVHFLVAYPTTWSYVSADQAGTLFLKGRTLLYRKYFRLQKELLKRVITSQPILAPASHQSKVYRSGVLNKDGDIAMIFTKMEKPKEGFWLPRYINKPELLDVNAINALNEFASSQAKRGVRVVLTYPFISAGFYKECWSGISRLDSVLRSQLKFPIIGKPQDCVLPDECFFDTRYHVLTRYKDIRTRSIIPGLQSIEKTLSVEK